MLSEKEIGQGFKEGIDCSMVTLHECADKMGISGEEAYRIASCFGIGMMQGSVCGAISAGFIAIGRKYGNEAPNQMDQKGLVIAKREEFLKKFKAEFGEDITCPGLLKLDFRIPEEAKKAQESGIIFTVCPKICKKSIAIIREMI